MAKISFSINVVSYTVQHCLLQLSEYSKMIGTETVSIFTIEDTYESKTRDENENNEVIFNQKSLYTAVLSFIKITTFCVLFAIPWTTVPRTNSIIHRSHWMEVLLPVSSSFILSAGSFLMDLRFWTQEKALISIRVYLKMYFIILTPCTVLYIACHMIWSLWLHYNHPLPYLAIVCLLPTWSIWPFALWYILPSVLLENLGFRFKLRIYMNYFAWFLIMVFQNEVLSFLFANAPTGSQFLVVFLLAACQKFDIKLRSKLIFKMMGNLNEAGMAILAADVNIMYSTFIAIRLVGAELATVYCSVVVGFASHLWMTYRIVKDSRKIINVDLEIQNSGRNAQITKLIIAELIEGLAPIIYGIHMAMAYYGPNAHIFSNVGNSYWSKAMKDIRPVLLIMSILFFVDLLSVMINSFLLWKILNVNMFKRFKEVLCKYWFIIAVPLELSMSLYLACTDVNLGIDETHSYPWISREGRQYLIYNLTDPAVNKKNTFL